MAFLISCHLHVSNKLDIKKKETCLVTLIWSLGGLLPASVLEVMFEHHTLPVVLELQPRLRRLSMHSPIQRQLECTFLSQICVPFILCVCVCVYVCFIDISGDNLVDRKKREKNTARALHRPRASAYVRFATVLTFLLLGCGDLLFCRAFAVPSEETNPAG